MSQKRSTFLIVFNRERVGFFDCRRRRFGWAEFQGHLRGFLPSFFFTEFFSASPRSAAAEIAKMATARVASIFATRCDTKENPKKRNKRRTKSRGRTLFAWVYLVLRVTDFRNAYGRNSLAAGPQRQWKWKRRSFEGLGKI